MASRKRSPRKVALPSKPLYALSTSTMAGGTTSATSSSVVRQAVVYLSAAGDGHKGTGGARR
jgi:hypothetical protein